MNIKTLMDFGLDEKKATLLLQQIEKEIDIQINKKVSKEKDNFEKQLLKLKQKSMIENELILAGARNVKAVFALINFDEDDFSDFDFNDIKNQIRNLKFNSNTSFLFKHDEQEKSQNEHNFKFTGFKPFESNLPNNINIKSMDYEQLCNYYDNFN